MKPDPAGTSGNVTAPGEVTFIRILPGPLERVWAFLTDSVKEVGRSPTPKRPAICFLSYPKCPR